jgi:hypothetical protein
MNRNTRCDRKAVWQATKERTSTREDDSRRQKIICDVRRRVRDHPGGRLKYRLKFAFEYLRDISLAYAHSPWFAIGAVSTDDIDNPVGIRAVECPKFSSNLASYLAIYDEMGPIEELTHKRQIKRLSSAGNCRTDNHSAESYSSHVGNFASDVDNHGAKGRLNSDLGSKSTCNGLLKEPHPVNPGVFEGSSHCSKLNWRRSERHCGQYPPT